MAAQQHTPGRRSPKDKICHTRTLKVRKGFYSRLIKDKGHPSFDRTVFVTVPWINLHCSGSIRPSSRFIRRSRSGLWRGVWW